MEIASARHKRTAPLNQRGEIADLRCIVVVVEDLQPLGPEVEQSLGHTFPATEIKPGMCHHRHAAVVPDQGDGIPVIHEIDRHERRPPLRPVIQIKIDVGHIAPRSALAVRRQQRRVVRRIRQHHFGDQFQRGQLPARSRKHRRAVDRKPQLAEPVHRLPECLRDLRRNVLLQRREIPGTPVDAVSQQVQVDAFEIAIDLDAGHKSQPSLRRAPGGFVQPPHAIVIRQREYRRPRSRTPLRNTRDRDFAVAAVSGVDVQIHTDPVFHLIPGARLWPPRA